MLYLSITFFFVGCEAQEAFRLLIFNYIACLSIGLLQIQYTPKYQQRTMKKCLISFPHEVFIEIRPKSKENIESNKFLRMCLFVFNLIQNNFFLFGFCQLNELETRKKQKQQKLRLPCLLQLLTQFNNRQDSDSKLYKLLIESYLLGSFFILSFSIAPLSNRRWTNETILPDSVVRRVRDVCVNRKMVCDLNCKHMPEIEW